MRTIYNGVDMMVQETIRYDMEPVYDDSGTDYLYTRHMLVVRAIVNGQADVFTGKILNGVFVRSGPFMSYTRQGGFSTEIRAGNNLGGARNLRVTDMQIPRPEWGADNRGFLPSGAPSMDRAPSSTMAEVVPTAGASPVLTIDAIRQRLMSPRGSLFILSGGWGVAPGVLTQPYEVLLMTPQAGMKTDCKNGPSPRLLSITAAMGDTTTLVVEFAVEAFVSDAPINGVSNSGALLSNRFKQVQTVLENGHTVVQTRGQAIFRTDALYHLMESPDSRRSILVLPIPIGFIRGNISVEGLEDVTGVVYSFEDRQVPVNFAAAPFAKAAHIAAVHRQAITCGQDILQGALTTYERILSMRANKKFGDTDFTDKSGKTGGLTVIQVDANNVQVNQGGGAPTLPPP